LLQDKFILDLLKENGSLKQIHKNEEIDERYPKIIASIFNKIPEKLNKFLTINKLKIIFIKNKDIKCDEGHLYGYSIYNDFKIFLAIDRSGLLCVKNIVHNLTHELGHFAFCYLIGLSLRDVKVKNLVEKFMEKKEGCSVLADKYMKHIYAQQLRKDNKHIMMDVDIKYHENFAELFRIYIESLISQTFSPMLEKFALNEMLPYLT
jgi:hypothetical protein